MELHWKARLVWSLVLALGSVACSDTAKIGEPGSEGGADVPLGGQPTDVGGDADLDSSNSEEGGAETPDTDPDQGSEGATPDVPDTGPDIDSGGSESGTETGEGDEGDTDGIEVVDADPCEGAVVWAPKPDGLPDSAIANLETLGPTADECGVNFSVYSEHAERIEVLIFDDPEVETPAYRFPLTRFGNVWNVYVGGIGYGTHYGYVAWGPNWTYDSAFTCGSEVGYSADVDAAGNRYNPNKLLIDPYAKAVHRDHKWNLGIPATGHGRKHCTWDASAKSVVVKSEYTWSANEANWLAHRANPNAPGNGWHEQVVYEVHVKGFTMIPSSGVPHPGTFRGLAENVQYLVDLGVTVVELMPVHEKPLDDGGYWGYNNISFFAPENSYASTTDPAGMIDEFKYMVDVLHQNGIELWIDVVYNHTGEGGNWTKLPVGFLPRDTVNVYSFRGLDNQAYYALTADNAGYWPNTGVGNQTRSNHDPFRELTMDSLRYYVEELHVDGFRFDLAPVLGAKDGNYDQWDDSATNIVNQIINDPVILERNTRIVAEPWSVGGAYSSWLGKFPSSEGSSEVAWYEWNGEFKNWWRSFLNNDNHKLSSKVGAIDGGGTLTGSYNLFGPSGRRPYHSVNYITVHDGMTLYDLFSYNFKQNGCGPLSPICCTEPESPWCAPEGGDDNNTSRDWGAENEAFKRQLIRNAYVAMLLSHGTPMIYGGDEWLRTQFGNNNPWTASADNSDNWFKWGAWKQDDARVRMHDFVRKLIQFRKARLPALAPTEYVFEGFQWRNASNTGSPDWNSRHLAVWYDSPPGGVAPFIVLINLERYKVDFALPPGSWRRIVDTQRWFDDNPYLEGAEIDPKISHNISLQDGVVVTGEYGVPDSTIVVLEGVSP